MTANQITVILVPIVILGSALVVYLGVRKKRKTVSPQTHGPHTPEPDYDPKEMAKSKGMGMADGGDG